MVKRMTEETPAPNASFYLGFDGGGTKTDCILVDADSNVLARATAGPSNPLRAGYAKAWFTLSDAADVVLERHHLKASDIRGICAGIGGAGRDSVAKRIATFLERAFPEAAVTVTTDLAITLNAAVGEGEGIILVVGTGSAAYGRDVKGRTAIEHDPGWPGRSRAIENQPAQVDDVLDAGVDDDPTGSWARENSAYA